MQTQVAAMVGHSPLVTTLQHRMFSKDILHRSPTRAGLGAGRLNMVAACPGNAGHGPLKQGGYWDKAICVSLRSPERGLSAPRRDACRCMAKKKKKESSDPTSESKGPSKKVIGHPLDEGDPWLGAIIFRPSVGKTEFTYSTTLERLGLPDLASPAAEALAKAIAAKAPGDDSGGTVDGVPVMIEMRTAKSGRDTAVSGSVETVLGLQCTRCLAPTTYRVDAPFDLLLTANPVMEPTLRSVGVVLGEDKWNNEDEEDDFLEGFEGSQATTGLLDLDLDDKIYFPLTQESIDLSKYFRDTIHLELPLKLHCQENCKGMCLECGANWNVKTCRCGEDDEGSWDFPRPTGGAGTFKGSLADQIKEQLRRKGKGLP